MTPNERLREVEGQLARMKCHQRLLLAATVMVGLAVAASLAIATGTGRRWQATKDVAPATAAGRRDVVKAPGFILADEDGKERAMMFGDGVPCLIMSDEGQMTRLMLSVMRDGAALTLYDPNERKRISICVSKYLPCLTIYGESEKPRIELGVLGEEPILRLYRDNGTEAWDKRSNDAAQWRSRDEAENLKMSLLLLESELATNEKQIKDHEDRLSLVEGRVLVLEGNMLRLRPILDELR